MSVEHCNEGPQWVRARGVTDILWLGGNNQHFLKNFESSVSRIKILATS